MHFEPAFIALFIAASVTAKPALQPRDGLVTFCSADNGCVKATPNVDIGCVDLPESSETITTASLTGSPGIECILSPEPGCLGGLGLLFNDAGTVEISSLGISNVESYLCTSDVDIINLCFPELSEGCFQSTTVTDGCADLTEFSIPFVSMSLTTAGTNCTVFQDRDCAGPSAVIAEPSVTVELASVGLNNVQSISCVNN
ncbi:hypothetical protein MSAN_00112800 [Mycena sanguinolenta]|uniref:Uncharacterized protein n=1 Tax=Mycena sanguinolenta TaxID=230812 RepID=A0A8H6ZDC2_9AGAR|nr:hypothetical protein MSAN_00112800 [Mycena sanguinolenta]